MYSSISGTYSIVVWRNVCKCYVIVTNFVSNCVNYRHINLIGMQILYPIGKINLVTISTSIGAIVNLLLNVILFLCLGRMALHFLHL